MPQMPHAGSANGNHVLLSRNPLQIIKFVIDFLTKLDQSDLSMQKLGMASEPMGSYLTGPDFDASTECDIVLGEGGMHTLIHLQLSCDSWLQEIIISLAVVLPLYYNSFYL